MSRSVRLVLDDEPDAFNRKIFLKSANRFTAAVLSLLLLLASPLSSAFKLGDMQGAALIGRPLDVSVQVQAAAGEDVAATCFAADVFYAEAQQKVPQLSVGALSAAPESVAQVRIQLDEPVAETFVTVVLTSRCGTQSARRYVLLADIVQPALTTPTPALIVLPVRTAQPTEPAASAVGVVASAQIAEPRDQAARASEPEKPARTVKKPVAKTATGKPAVVKEVATGKARLKLDAMAFLSDRMDSLDAPMVFAPTEDTLLHAKQIATLESDLKNLRKQAASSELRLLELQTQLQLAQSQQVPMWAIYAGAAVLLMGLLAFAWRWQRQRGVRNDWWHDPDKDDEAVTASRTVGASQTGFAPTVQAVPAVALKPVVAAPASTSQGSAPAVDIDITTGSFMLSSLKRAAENPDGSRSTKGHHLMAEDVQDVRQQADFFVSLGQTERALDILCKHISQAADPHPLLHLDLIALYHALGMKSDFYAQREIFRSHFNGVIPEFADFTHESRSLEDYPEVIAELIRLWPNVQAFAYVDACIYRDVDEQGELFELAAFRDLLTLHALAEVVATETSVPPPRASVPTSIHKKTTAAVAVAVPVSQAAPPALPPLPQLPPQVPPVRATVPSIDSLTPAAAVPLVSDDELLASLPSAFANFELHLAPSGAAGTEQAPESVPESESESETRQGQLPLDAVAAATFDQTQMVVQPDLGAETKSGMLDLDFSNLESSGTAGQPQAEPTASTSSARYAIRSRWPVVKKSGKTD